MLFAAFCAGKYGIAEGCEYDDEESKGGFRGWCNRDRDRFGVPNRPPSFFSPQYAPRLFCLFHLARDLPLVGGSCAPTCWRQRIKNETYFVYSIGHDRCTEIHTVFPISLFFTRYRGCHIFPESVCRNSGTVVRTGQP